MVNAIEINGLSKYYNNFCAVDNINLNIKKGICFGILGPNGAGKTSLLEMIEGISKITSGTVSINGMNVTTQLPLVQQMISVQLQENNYFDYVSIAKILKFFLAMYPKSEKTPLSLLKLVGLEDKKNALYKHLSGGQKQRFSIAITLVNDADIYFLDEPTTGLDPQNRQHIWAIIKNLIKAKKTVILTTHYMEEAENLCDELIIMDHGKIIASGTCEELKKQITGNESVAFELTHKLANLSELEKRLINATIINTNWENQYKIWTGNLMGCIQSLIEYTKESNNPLKSLNVFKITLEDVFLKLTGRELRE